MVQAWIEFWAWISLATFIFAMYNRIVHNRRETFTVGELAKIIFVSLIPVVNIFLILIFICETLSDVPQWVFNTFDRISRIELLKGKR